MAADDHLVLQPAPTPEATERRPHRLAIGLSSAALFVALVAAGATVYQGIQAKLSRGAADRSAAAAENSAREAASLNRLTIDSLEVARIAATASQTSAQAAVAQVALAALGNEQARGANLLTVESLRARVTVRGVTLKKAVAASEPIDGTVHIENSGASEALNVRIRWRVLVDAALPSGSMPPFAFPAGASSATLAPQGKAADDFSLPAVGVTPPAVAALLTRRLRIFVFGSVSYSTLRAVHETFFCYWASPTSPTDSYPCEKWNITQ